VSNFASGNNNDRDGWVDRPDSRGQLKAVKYRHLKIGDDQIDLRSFNKVQCFQTAGKRNRFEVRTNSLHDLRDQRQRIPVIVDEDATRFRAHDTSIPSPERAVKKACLTIL
jgi:hypothetical protein